MKVRVQFDEEMCEQVPTTTAGVAYQPFPFPGPVILKPGSLIDAGAVKAREACRRAMQAYIHGQGTKDEVDRICKGAMP